MDLIIPSSYFISSLQTLQVFFHDVEKIKVFNFF